MNQNKLRYLNASIMIISSLGVGCGLSTRADTRPLATACQLDDPNTPCLDGVYVCRVLATVDEGFRIQGSTTKLAGNGTCVTGVDRATLARACFSFCSDLTSGFDKNDCREGYRTLELDATSQPTGFTLEYKGVADCGNLVSAAVQREVTGTLLVDNDVIPLEGTMVTREHSLGMTVESLDVSAVGAAIAGFVTLEGYARMKVEPLEMRSREVAVAFAQPGDDRYRVVPSSLDLLIQGEIVATTGRQSGRFQLVLADLIGASIVSTGGGLRFLMEAHDDFDNAFSLDVETR